MFSRFCKYSFFSIPKYYVCPGLFSVWDLRNFQSTDAPPQPLARFTCHKKPITSIEWHPSDESMIVVSDEDATYIYDLSIEEDEEEEDGNGNGNGKAASEVGEGEIPPQLLFVHCGSQNTKEVHWHPQITSLVMTTALSGYSSFIPSNL
jgi:ribosome assembly protein RRB1